MSDRVRVEAFREIAIRVPDDVQMRLVRESRHLGKWVLELRVFAKTAEKARADLDKAVRAISRATEGGAP